MNYIPPIATTSRARDAQGAKQPRGAKRSEAGAKRSPELPGSAPAVHQTGLMSREWHARISSATARPLARQQASPGARSAVYHSPGRKAPGGDLIGTSVNVASEYGTQQVWGKDKSGYDALGRPDAGRLGAFAGSLAIAANKDSIARAEAERAQLELEYAKRLSQQANDENSRRQAAAILQAYGYKEEEIQRFMAYEGKSIDRKTAAYLAWVALNPELNVNEAQFTELYNAIGGDASISDIQQLVNERGGGEINWQDAMEKAGHVQQFDADNAANAARNRELFKMFEAVLKQGLQDPELERETHGASWWDSRLYGDSTAEAPRRTGPAPAGPGFLESADRLGHLLNRGVTMEYAGMAKGLFEQAIMNARMFDALWQAKAAAQALGFDVPDELKYASVTDLLALGQKELYARAGLNPEKGNALEEFLFARTEFGSALLPVGGITKAAAAGTRGISVFERVTGWCKGLGQETDLGRGIMDLADTTRSAESLFAPGMKAMNAALSKNPLRWADEVGSQAAVVSGGGELVNPVLSNGRQYSSLFRTTLEEVGASRGSHRAFANKDFYNTMAKNPEFKALMDRGFAYDVMQRMESGVGALKNPSSQWIWHHTPGTKQIELIPRVQHIDPAMQAILHPFGAGGYAGGLGVFW